MRRTYIISIASELTLAACNVGGNDQRNADLNVTDPNAANELMADQNAVMGSETGGINANIETNPATEDAMANEMSTNDSDTNLANGI